MNSGSSSREGQPQGEATAADAIAAKLRSGFGDLVARAGEGAERLKKAAEGMRNSPILQQGIAARERGNLEAAFWLLDEGFREDSQDPGAAQALWDVACSLDLAKAASAAAQLLIDHHAAAGEESLAVQYWDEFASRVEVAFVAPAAVARMWPQLEAAIDGADDEDRAHAVNLAQRALRGVLEPSNQGLSPGLALRLAEAGRELDPDTARELAQVALRSPNLHEAKRARLESWVHPVAACEGAVEEPGLVSTSVPAAAPLGSEPDPLHAALSHPLHESVRRTDALSEDEIAAAAERLRRVKPASEAAPPTDTSTPIPEIATAIAGIEVAIPVEFGDDALILRLRDGDSTRHVAYADVEAVSVALVHGLAERAVLVIDLLTGGHRGEGAPRGVRLRDDLFDPKTLTSGSSDLEDARRALLEELLERTHAVPLPDPEGALGLQYAEYPSLDDYDGRA